MANGVDNEEDCLSNCPNGYPSLFPIVAVIDELDTDRSSNTAFAASKLILCFLWFARFFAGSHSILTTHSQAYS